MEYIEGADLARMVREKGPLPVDQACEYIRQTALGLQHAHERGLVHRDIKPANLLVASAVSSDRRRASGLLPRPPGCTRTNNSSGMISRLLPAHAYPWGVVKILDMGLARCTESFTGRAATHLTQIGSVMGTPEFIAPEQARDSHTSDIRADLYSVGCTLYFLLTGRAPFPNGTLTEKLLQHQMDEPDSVRAVRRERLLAWKGPNGSEAIGEEILHVPTQVVRILSRLMEKNADDRYQTPLELANALQPIVAHLAAGTLPKEEGETTVEPAAPGPSASPPTPAEPPSLMQPIVRLSPQRPPTLDVAGKATFLLAMLAGLISLFLVSVFVALMWR
jgi:serine/threonine-protein kinase